MQPSVSVILKCSPQDHRAVGDLWWTWCLLSKNSHISALHRAIAIKCDGKIMFIPDSLAMFPFSPRQSFLIKSEKGYMHTHTHTHTHTEFWVTLSRWVYWWKWGPFWMKLNLGLSLFSGRKRLLLGRDRCGRDENWKKIKRDAFLGQVSSVVKSTVLAQPCLYNFWQNTEFGSRTRH